jgi:hypothetical protein
VSKIRWTGAPAGIGYGFAFNDHLAASRAVRQAQQPENPPADQGPEAGEGDARQRKTPGS